MFPQGTEFLAGAIKTDRAVRLALFDFVAALLLIPAWFFYDGIVIPYLFQGSLVLPTPKGCIVISLFILPITCIARYFKLRNVAKKRVAAINGNWELRIANQPDVSQVLSTEIVAVQDSRPRFILFSILGLVTAVLFIVLPILLVDIDHPSPYGSAFDLIDPTTWVTVLFAIILVVIIYLIYQSRMVSRLEVTPEGLACVYLGQREALSWESIRSFGYYTQEGSGKNATTIYEVAGIDESACLVVVRWRLLRKNFFITISPEMTPEAYTTLLDRLSAQIVTKTNLPLLNFDAGAK